MKQMRKLLALLLTMTILLSLLGCTPSQHPGNDDPTTKPTQAAPTGVLICPHSMEIIQATASTCTTSGSVVSVCTLCGEEFVDELPANGHSWADASCILAKSCTLCGITEGNALGHNYVSGKCDRCGTQMPGYEEKPAGCAHEYTLTTQTTPSCTTSGSMTYICKKCGVSYTEQVTSTGHTFSEATCDTPKTCRICGSTDGNSLGHNYANGICSRCGAEDPSVPKEVTYTVTVRSDKGKLIEGVTVNIYTTEDTPAARGKTDNQGVATMTLMSAASYKIILTDIPDGLSAKASYTFRSTTVNINLATVSQISPTDHSKANYRAGSIMGDFTLTDTDGNIYNLAQLLKEKELVILNFWFVNCGPCKAEFPYFETIYQKYADDVQLLTINHFDSEDQIKQLRQQMGVTFPMIKENIGFREGFDIIAYPTTVFIDKTGKILKIQVGDFKSEQELANVIEGFLK